MWNFLVLAFKAVIAVIAGIGLLMLWINNRERP